jgi:hypothetical protein
MKQARQSYKVMVFLVHLSEFSREKKVQNGKNGARIVQKVPLIPTSQLHPVRFE